MSMNLRPLYSMLESEGINDVRITLVCDGYRTETSCVECYPDDKSLSDEIVLNPQETKEITGKDRGEMALWEVVEEVARLAAIETGEDWRKAEVTLLVPDRKVAVEVEVMTEREFVFDIDAETFTVA